jgi:tetratricopeptide (TPR) repeat protein
VFADPRFEELFVPIALIVVVVLLGVVWVMGRRRAKAAAVAASQMGAGSALACALDADLDGAQRVLEAQIRRPGGRTPDAVVGLIAVLRARQSWSRATELLDRLAQGRRMPWLAALRVRLSLDTGAVDAAIELVAEDDAVPSELAVAAYARGGRWRDAHARYRKSTSRKDRREVYEANLLGGVAVELAEAGDDRGARKALKKAQGLDPAGLLVQLAAERLRPEGEGKETTGPVRARVPWLFPAAGGRISPDEAAQAVLDDARAQYDQGHTELALGHLRDALEARPHLHALRMQYADWILDSGEPSDWRAELSEVLEMLHRLEPNRVRPSCGGCGFHGVYPFAVCPRCNAVGSVVVGGLDDQASAGLYDMSAHVAVARFWGRGGATTRVDSVKP